MGYHFPSSLPLLPHHSHSNVNPTPSSKHTGFPLPTSHIWYKLLCLLLLAVNHVGQSILSFPNCCSPYAKWSPSLPSPTDSSPDSSLVCHNLSSWNANPNLLVLPHLWILYLLLHNKEMQQLSLTLKHPEPLAYTSYGIDFICPLQGFGLTSSSQLGWD
jgi:hypothetical protein